MVGEEAFNRIMIGKALEQELVKPDPDHEALLRLKA